MFLPNFVYFSLIKAPNKGGGLRPPPQRGAAFGRPPFVDSLMSCHNRDLVLPQHISCLSTTHVLSWQNTHFVLPQQTYCLAATHILSSQNRGCVLAEQSKIQKTSKAIFQRSCDEFSIQDLTFAWFFGALPMDYPPAG